MYRFMRNGYVVLSLVLAYCLQFCTTPEAVATKPQSSSFAGNYAGWLDGKPILFSISQTGKVEGVWQSGFAAPNDLNSLTGAVNQNGELDARLSIVIRKPTGKYSKTGYPYYVIGTVRLIATGLLVPESDGSLSGWLLIETESGERILVMSLIPY